jgi:hypothetical protein
MSTFARLNAIASRLAPTRICVVSKMADTPYIQCGSEPARDLPPLRGLKPDHHYAQSKTRPRSGSPASAQDY